MQALKAVAVIDDGGARVTERQINIARDDVVEVAADRFEQLARLLELGQYLVRSVGFFGWFTASLMPKFP